MCKSHDAIILNKLSNTLFLSMYHIFFVHFSVEGHIGCLQILHIINRKAMNMADQVSLWEDEVSFGYMANSDKRRPPCTLIDKF